MTGFAQVRVGENTCPGAGTRVPFDRGKDVKRSGGKSGNGSTTDLPGATRMTIPGGYPVVRVTGAPAELSELAAEYPAYEFATQQTSDGISIIARRHGGGTRPGLYAVVTNDVGEMRRALLEQ